MITDLLRPPFPRWRTFLKESDTREAVYLGQKGPRGSKLGEENEQSPPLQLSSPELKQKSINQTPHFNLLYNLGTSKKVIQILSTEHSEWEGGLSISKAIYDKGSHCAQRTAQLLPPKMEENEGGDICSKKQVWIFHVSDIWAVAMAQQATIPAFKQILMPFVKIIKHPSFPDRDFDASRQLISLLVSI